MTRLLEAVLEISISSGIIWAATMALKKGLHTHLSPRAHLAVWLVLIVRLMLPVTIETGVHLITVPSEQNTTASTQHAAFETTGITQVWTEKPRSDSVRTAASLQHAAGGLSTSVLREDAQPKQEAVSFSWQADPAELAVSIWLTGILFGTALSLCGYDRMRRNVKTRLVPGADPLHILFQECLREVGIQARVVLAVQNELAGPALMYPNIVLISEDMRSRGPEEIRMALRHELTHFRRRDHLKSLGLNVLRIVWWFNPFVWLAARTIREDIETACDCDVVQPLGKSGKNAYAKAVLSMYGRTETCQAVLGMAFGGAKKNAEKRIRGIYMKKKSSKRGRTASICLAAILCVTCLTTACQPTPELEAVVNQNEGVPEGALVGESQSADPMATTAPAATYTSAEHWSETIDKAENFKVTADVDIMVPDVAAYPVEKIAPREITQELADQMIAYLAPNAEFYRTSEQRTKAEWEEVILNMRETLAEDQAKGDEDAAAQDQATIDEWTRLYENAPTETQRVPADTTFGYMYDYYDGSELTENGPNYIAVSAAAPDGSVQQFDVRRKDDSDPSQFPYFSYVNANYQTISTDEDTKRQNDLSRSSIEKLEEPLRSEELERVAALDAETTRRLTLYDENPMDETAATARAAEVLEGLGIYGTQITACEKALLGTYTGETVDALLDGSTENLSEHGIYLEFRRENGGVPCIEPEIQFLNPAQAGDAYSAPFRPETGSMLLDEEGNVRMFQWESPSEAVEIVAPDSELISLREAKNRLVEEIYRRELAMSDEFLSESPMEFTVESMDLVMGYAEAKDAPQDALAIPAWRMTAQGTSSVDGETIILSDNEVMISALDGRPILMAGTRQ